MFDSFSGDSPIGLENSETRVGLRVRSTRGIPESGGSNPRANRPHPPDAEASDELCIAQVQSGPVDRTGIPDRQPGAGNTPVSG